CPNMFVRWNEYIKHLSDKEKTAEDIDTSETLLGKKEGNKDNETETSKPNYVIESIEETQTKENKETEKNKKETADEKNKRDSPQRNGMVTEEEDADCMTEKNVNLK
ncbi:Hypothetical protein FKW44_013088, partial [Caligus rogercresseyi]